MISVVNLTKVGGCDKSFKNQGTGLDFENGTSEEEENSTTRTYVRKKVKKDRI